MLNTTNTEFSSIEVWFTDKNGKQLEMEININDSKNWVDIIKMGYSTKPKYKNMLKVMVFCHFQEHLEINIVKK